MENNIRVNCTVNVSSTSTAPKGAFDNTAFTILADQAFAAAYALNQHPSDASAAAYMNALNALNNYLTANPPPSGSLGAQIATDLGASAWPGVTVAQCCAAPTNATYVQWVETHTADPAITALYNDFYNASNVYSTNPAILQFKRDITDMQGHLSNFQTDMQYDVANKIDPTTDPHVILDLQAIAQDVALFNKEATAFGALGDGFLSYLVTFTTSPATAGSTSSFLSICQALVTTPSDATAQKNMLTALQNMGDDSASGGSFADAITKILSEESGNWPSA